jgi:hypothetical protein
MSPNLRDAKSLSDVPCVLDPSRSISSELVPCDHPIGRFSSPVRRQSTMGEGTPGASLRSSPQGQFAHQLVTLVMPSSLASDTRYQLVDHSDDDAFLPEDHIPNDHRPGPRRNREFQHLTGLQFDIPAVDVRPCTAHLTHC